MIEVRKVSKRYGGVSALTDVSISVEKGRALGLLGQNGAGKTTLLSIITGFLAPTAGCALIDGHDPLLSPMEARRLIGYMPEHPPLYDEMTVMEYLTFVSRLKLVAAKAIPPHISEIMERTGLAEMRHRKLGNLSKGFRQRAGIAQALCGDPETLILDEPTSGLDPKQICEVRELIKSLTPSHTIVFSSHMLPEVEQLCDRVAILHNGRIMLDAPLGDTGGRATLCCLIGAGRELLSRHLSQLEGISSIALTQEGENTLATLAFSAVESPERALFSLLSGLGIPLLRLTRAKGSLESVFLSVISGEEASK